MKSSCLLIYIGIWNLKYYYLDLVVVYKGLVKEKEVLDVSFKVLF